MCIYVLTVIIFPGLAKLIFATYNNIEEFLKPQGDEPVYSPETTAPPPQPTKVEVVFEENPEYGMNEDYYNMIPEVTLLLCNT